MVCSKCCLDLEPSNFAFKNLNSKQLRHICRNCQASYRRVHYLNNRRKYIDKAKKWNKKQSQILADFIFSILSHSRCVDCGEKDVLVLEFDHIENKKMGIAEMYKCKYSIAAIQKELDKCVVRCANCHRRKTAKETGFWKYKLSLN